MLVVRRPSRSVRAVRHFQLVALCIGILVLLMIDSLLILAHGMQKGALFATDTDLLVWAVLIAVYLTSMAVAMYPGRPDPSPVEWRDFDPFTDISPAGAPNAFSQRQASGYGEHTNYCRSPGRGSPRHSTSMGGLGPASP
jgi:hypothetical protein